MSVTPSRRYRSVASEVEMAQVMKKVDAVIVGFGWTGAIMAKELTEAGLHVVALGEALPVTPTRTGSIRRPWTS